MFVLLISSKENLEKSLIYPILWASFIRQIIMTILYIQQIAVTIFSAYIAIFLGLVPPPADKGHYLDYKDDYEQKYPRIGNSLELDEDIYALTFVSYLKSENERICKPTWVMNQEEEEEHNILWQKRGELFSVCILLIVSQTLLIYLIAGEIRDDFQNKGMAEPLIITTRFICCIILHCSMMGEIKQGLAMMKYSIVHRQLFNGYGMAFFIGFAQMLVTVMVELVNLFVTCTNDSVSDIVADFIVFEIIA